jgi:hypothetical protein
MSCLSRIFRSQSVFTELATRKLEKPKEIMKHAVSTSESITEAEYITLCSAAKQAKWVQMCNWHASDCIFR